MALPFYRLKRQADDGDSDGKGNSTTLKKDSQFYVSP